MSYGKEEKAAEMKPYHALSQRLRKQSSLCPDQPHSHMKTGRQALSPNTHMLRCGDLAGSLKGLPAQKYMYKYGKLPLRHPIKYTEMNEMGHGGPGRGRRGSSQSPANFSED